MKQHTPCLSHTLIYGKSYNRNYDKSKVIFKASYHGPKIIQKWAQTNIIYELRYCRYVGDTHMILLYCYTK